MYEDGSDGVARDDEKSMQATARARDLGDARACEWVKSHPDLRGTRHSRGLRPLRPEIGS
jgi:TPR repeat protein